MFGSDSSRQARRGRGSSIEAFAAELSQLRSQSYVDQLEVVRLGAMVQGLTHHLDRLSDELQEARNEALLLRMMPTSVDPRIEEMAREILQLRDVIAAQQSSIVEMTSRVGDLLVQVAANAPRELPSELPARAEEPVRQEAAVTVLAAARSAGPSDYVGIPGIEIADREPTVVANPARSSVDEYAFAVTPAPSVEEPTGEFDDATLRRLRLIRQAFEN